MEDSFLGERIKKSLSLLDDDLADDYGSVALLSKFVLDTELERKKLGLRLADSTLLYLRADVSCVPGDPLDALVK